MQSWEAEAKAKTGSGACLRKPRSAAGEAVRAWQRVGAKGRAALQKLSIDRIHDLEACVSAFLASVCSTWHV